jgi:Protein of unknown function (DUF1569)
MFRATAALAISTSGSLPTVASTRDPRRRTPEFRELDDVMRDVDALASGGYDRVGNWDLSQICGHIAQWMSYSVKGYPRGPAPIRLMMALLRVTIGKSLLRKTLSSGFMDAGAPTLKQTIPAATSDPTPAINELRRVIEDFKSHKGDYQVSPFFGPMTREQMTRLQLIHCAHHLSFLKPKT